MKIPSLVSGCMLMLVLPSALCAGDVCKQTAKHMRKAAVLESRMDRAARRAECLNHLDPDVRAACKQAVKEEYQAARQLASQQYMARLDLCDHVGTKAYEPVVDPTRFVTVIDNPLLPRPVGGMWRYEGTSQSGSQTLEVTVLPATREILGVSCASVQCVTACEGQVMENRTEWIAQDVFENVWLFGETARHYEDGFLVSLKGSWVAGMDGAKPGVLMSGGPIVGTTFRNGWALGVAESATSVVSDNATVTIALGTYAGCLRTEQLCPLTPDVVELCVFAPNVGLIRATRPGAGWSLELVGYGESPR